MSLMTMIQVLKMGGNELADPDWPARFAQVVAELPGRNIIVHGGGRMIADLQSRLGIRPCIIDGLRVTGPETLDVTQMVLSGRVNKLLVAALLHAGVKAVGLSGVDGGLLRCRKKIHPQVDLGLVGEIEQVETELLHTLLAGGWTPVVSPVSLGPAGQPYNVNADEAAAAIAGAIPAQTLTFITNTPGVLDNERNLLPALNPQQAGQLIEAGIIEGGMIPKVQAAVQALEQGVAEARIVDLAGLSIESGTSVFRDYAVGGDYRRR